jgi:hypothetical protein
MSISNIITIILGSSLLSAFLAILGNWYLQKDNYRNEYYKKILEKRFEAYEGVGAIVSEMTTMVHMENGLCNAFLAFGKHDFDEFAFKIVPLIMKSFWLDNKLANELTKFNVFLLNEITFEIKMDKNADLELRRLGVLNRNKIKEFRDNFEYYIKKDIKNLHEVTRFMKQKKGEEFSIQIKK